MDPPRFLLLPSRSRLSGTDGQMCCQRRERTMVQAAFLTGRREMMLPSTQSGRRLMRSSSPSIFVGPKVAMSGRADRSSSAQGGQI
jgi:hypothetical protein